MAATSSNNGVRWLWVPAFAGTTACVPLKTTATYRVGFGAGRHRCIGSFIAKTELRLAFAEILARFAGFRLADRGEILYTTGLGQGIIALPMVFSRA